MALGIMETVSSIALVSMPPGNVVRQIAELRRSFWVRAHGTGSRAWFDYPVLAWLGAPIDGARLAGLASRCTIQFELASVLFRPAPSWCPARQGIDVFAGFSSGLVAWASKLGGTVEPASDATPFKPGPFEAGVGCYCASVASELAIPEDIVTTISEHPMRAKTHTLAQLELRWAPGPEFASSWATLSAARFGRAIRR
ncbi:MAG: hypothetical protein JXM71_02980 [Spirochaetales bacterium]|nr:hypothetical protein [Spirochaetales bacterium]